MRGVVMLLTSIRPLESKATDYFYNALHPDISSDTNLVSIPFGNDIYKILRNYLVGVTEPKEPGGYAQFTIEVLLPNFEPRNQANGADFNSAGFGNRLHADIQFGRKYISPQDALQEIMKFGGVSKDDYYVTRSGYRFYKLHPNSFGSELYVLNSQKEKFFFWCHTEKYVLYPGCEVMESIGKNVTAEYSFGQKYIDSAYDIDKSLIKFLDKFKK